jgi:hypothetical protein
MPGLQDPFPGDPQRAWQRRANPVLIALLHLVLESRLGCEGIVSKRLGSPYRAGRSPHWLKVKNPDAPAVRRLEEEDWA